MRVLVTGAGGFIGSHLCRALLEENHEVFALSRSEKNERIVSLLSQRRFHLVHGDLRTLPTLQEIMKTNRIDTVIHLAATPSHGSKEEHLNFAHFETNARGTLNVVHSCLLTGVSKIIYASGMGVYGQPQYLPVDENHPKKPIDFISLTKLQAENYCEFYAEHYNIHTVVLRYAGVYGFGKTKGAVYNFTKQVLNGELPQISSDGNQTKDLVYVGDVVNATLKALDIADDTAFDVFNVGSGRETSINELLSTIIEIIGADIDFRYTPKKSNDRFVLDITKAQKVLGYHPKSLNASLSEYIQQIKSGI